LTWHRLNLYAGHYTISIEKLRRGQNDATRARVAAGRAGPGCGCGRGVAWRGEARRGKRPWESRSLRDVRRSQCSPARVKTGDHVFGGVPSERLLATVCLHLPRYGYCSPSSSSVRLLFVIGAAGRNIGTATPMHCIERDDYTDKCYVD
jgi:hypothetical protein